MKTIFIFCVILFAPSIVFSQAENKQTQWAKIESPKGDLSVAVPSGFLVDNEDGEYRIIAFTEQVTMHVNVDGNGNAKSRLKMMRQFSSSDRVDAQITRFALGDFIGDVYKYESEKGFSMSIYAASSKAFYVISVSSKDAENRALLNFLHSIKLANQPLLKQDTQINQTTAAVEETAVSIATLKTNPIVLEALKRKTAVKVNVTYDFKERDIKGKTLPEDNNKYSRPLITLRKPRASYTDAARRDAFQGSIRLKILFRANGEIGDITVLTDAPKDLSKNTVDAAAKIKFLPAEIDGKAVDVSRVVEYTFTIY